MNKKIKLIDLLNKMAKKENLPKEIKFNGYIWLYIKRVSDYDSILLDGYLFKNYFNISQLNEEVEIIKEEKDTIEKISINGKDIHKLEKLGIYDVIENIESALNEIIDRIEKESK